MEKMKTVKFYLTTLPREDILYYTIEDLFELLTNPRIVYHFQDHTIKEMYNLCFQEAEKELDWLLSFTPYEFPDNNYSIIYTDSSGYHKNNQKFYYVHSTSVKDFKKYQNNLEEIEMKAKYSLEGTPPEMILNYRIASSSVEDIYYILYEILFECWYQWDDSAFRKILRDSNIKLPKTFKQLSINPYSPFENKQFSVLKNSLREPVIHQMIKNENKYRIEVYKSIINDLKEEGIW